MLKNALTANKLLKGLSLLLAIITWHAIQQNINYEAVISDIPLTIRAEEGWAVLDLSTETVDVHFRGPQEELLELDSDYIEVVVNVKGDDGSKFIELSPENVRVPGGVRVTRVRPDRIELTLDQEAEKKVPVKAATEGMPPNGYAVRRSSCAPATAVIRGPRGKIRVVDAVRTKPVSVTGRTATFKERVDVIVPGEAWIADIEPARVTVEVVIEEQTGSASLDDVDVKALLEPGRRLGVDLRPARVKVFLKGDKAFLQTLDRKAVQAYVDCTGLELQARYELPVKVSVPNGAVVERTEPATVEVMLESPQGM
jgi:YbbR domain-containing protein